MCCVQCWDWWRVTLLAHIPSGRAAFSVWGAESRGANQHWWQHLKVAQHKLKPVTEGGGVQAQSSRSWNTGQVFCPTRQQTAVTQDCGSPGDLPGSKDKLAGLRKQVWMPLHFSSAPTPNINKLILNFILWSENWRFTIFWWRGRGALSAILSFPFISLFFTSFTLPKQSPWVRWALNGSHSTHIQIPTSCVFCVPWLVALLRAPVKQRQVVKRNRAPEPTHTQEVTATVKTHLSFVFLLLDLCLSRFFIRLACKIKPHSEICVLLRWN